MYRCKTLSKALLALSSAVLLTACGSSGGGSGGGTINTGSGTLSLNITDAPIDGVRAVYVAFDAVKIKGSDGWTTIDIDGVKQLDLLSLSGPISEPLLEDQMLPVGTYTELRLVLLQDGTTNTPTSTYLETKNGQYFPLRVPSGSSSGLKIKTDVDVVVNGHIGFTIDFDLAKSLKQNGMGDYRLEPVLRIVNNLEYGHIEGSFMPAELNHANCDREESVAKVYLYPQGTTPVEMSTESAVITTATLELNETSGDYDYEFGYVAVGDYTLALTCDGDRDDPDAVDNPEAPEEPVVVFFNTWDTTVTAVEVPEQPEETEEESLD